MRDGVYRFRGILAAVMLAACSPSKAPPPPANTAANATSGPVSGPGCSATGEWKPCTILYRLERSGLAPHVDSAATPSEKTLTGTPLLLKIGLTATLELYLYPDSVARLADARKLDRSQFVGAGAPQTIKRERTLIESANVIALLTSINDHQRERVSDAITAGPPQPNSP